MRDINVLIVDDLGLIRDVVKNFFSIVMDCENVMAVNDGLAALDVLKESFFDLLITDYNMPGMFGEELIKKTKMLYPDMKTILMSGNNYEEVKKAAERAGADGFMTKPVDFQKLMGMINDLFPD